MLIVPVFPLCPSPRTGNGVRDGGAEALGVALSRNRSLTSLDLFGPRPWPPGLSLSLFERRLAGASADLGASRPRRLPDAANAVGDKGAAGLAEGLRCNSTLLILDLFGAPAEEEEGASAGGAGGSSGLPRTPPSRSRAPPSPAAAGRRQQGGAGRRDHRAVRGAAAEHGARHAAAVAPGGDRGPGRPPGEEWNAHGSPLGMHRD